MTRTTAPRTAAAALWGLFWLAGCGGGAPPSDSACGKVYDTCQLQLQVTSGQVLTRGECVEACGTGVGASAQSQLAACVGGTACTATDTLLKCFQAASSTTPPAGADCSDKQKCIIEDTGQLFRDYCAAAAGTKRMCDCPGGSPGGACTLSATGAANVYCCP